MSNSANDIKLFIKRIRKNDFVNKGALIENNAPNSNLSMRKLLSITRSLNEEIASANKVNPFDQKTEENKFRNYFSDLNVVIDLIPLEVYNDYVFWGGTINGTIQFVYKVTPDSTNSGVEFNYLDDFAVNNPDNQEIINRIEAYYDIFFKYWNENNFQK